MSVGEPTSLSLLSLSLTILEKRLDDGVEARFTLNCNGTGDPFYSANVGDVIAYFNYLSTVGNETCSSLINELCRAGTVRIVPSMLNWQLGEAESSGAQICHGIVG